MKKSRTKEKRPRRKKGQGCINQYGYIVVPNPRGGQMHQHRLIMEQHLGRPLLKEEKVHHKNGVRTDNRLENLELWTTNHCVGGRVEDMVAWAKKILELYGTH